MNKKEQAIARSKYFAMETVYLEAWKKNPSNPKLKEMWVNLVELRGYFDTMCQQAEYNHQAALERDDKFFLVFEENNQMKIRLEQMEQERQVLLNRISDYESGMSDKERVVEYKVVPDQPA